MSSMNSAAALACEPRLATPELAITDDPDHDAFIRGEVAQITVPQGMDNHLACFGLLPKKTPDGSRWIRYRYHTEPAGPENISGHGSSPSIALSHQPGTYSDLSCEFNHGVYDLSWPPLRAAEPRGPDKRGDFYAIMSLAQLLDMAPLCSFCSALAQGVERWRWMWQSEMNKFRYCDVVWDSRDVLEEDELNHLLDVVDDGYRDARFDPGLMTNDEVDLHVSFSQAGETVEVRVRKKPKEGMAMKATINLITLEFYVDEGTSSPWLSILPLPTISENLLSPDALEKTHKWLVDCTENHELCQNSQTKGTRPPTRLIEITGREGLPPHARLIEAKSHSPYKYVALSHSWASSRPLKTTRSSYAEHKDEILWGRLSQVYRETLLLAQALSVQFVWIDSLCIIQNDSEDWEQEAHHMGGVYKNAFVVFVALGGDLGLERHPVETITIPAADQGRGVATNESKIHVRRKCDHDNLVNSANDGSAGQWFQRGWCFQERLFSPRLLHFGGSMEDLTFECNTTLACECGSASKMIRRTDETRGELSSTWCHVKAQFTSCLHDLTSTLHLEKAENPLHETHDQLLALYIALCEDFSSKKFTFHDDALPAMDSLASKLAPYLGTYHAGIWEHNILIGLQWEAFNAYSSSRYSPCCAPSWSWASRSGGAVWYFQPTEVMKNETAHEFDCEVLDITTVPSNPLIPHGKIQSASLVLRGWGRPSTIEVQQPDDAGRVYMGGVEDENQWVQLDSREDVEDVVAGDEDSKLPVLCFQLMRTWAGDGSRRENVCASCIVLTLPRTSGDRLRRIGFAIVDSEWFDSGAEQVRVSIE